MLAPYYYIQGAPICGLCSNSFRNVKDGGDCPKPGYELHRCIAKSTNMPKMGDECNVR